MEDNNVATLFFLTKTKTKQTNKNLDRFMVKYTSLRPKCLSSKIKIKPTMALCCSTL